MRTDVKLGVVISMVVVFIAGGYFVFRGDQGQPINLADQATKPAPSASPAPVTPATDPSANRRNTGNAAANPNRINRQARPSTPPQNEQAANASPGRVDSPNSLAANKPSPSVTNAPPMAPAAGSAGQPGPAATDATTMPDRNVGADPSSPQTGNPAQPPSSAMEALAAMRKSAPAEKTSTPPTAAVDIHRTQPGDTLASLAQKYYGSAKYVPVLRQANPDVADPSSLRVGIAIRIPPLPADAATLAESSTPANVPAVAGNSTTPRAADKTGAGARTYVVKPGDSFYRIAEQQLGNASRWKELLTLNRALVDGDPTRLRVGQRVTLPSS